jgi:hyaluronan synthase
LYAVIVIFIALPVKAYAIATMNKQGWLTRTHDSIGGEGQSARTLAADNTTTPEMAR